MKHTKSVFLSIFCVIMYESEITNHHDYEYASVLTRVSTL